MVLGRNLPRTPQLSNLKSNQDTGSVRRGHLWGKFNSELDHDVEFSKNYIQRLSLSVVKLGLHPGLTPPCHLAVMKFVRNGTSMQFAGLTCNCSDTPNSAKIRLTDPPCLSVRYLSSNDLTACEVIDPSFLLVKIVLEDERGLTTEIARITNGELYPDQNCRGAYSIAKPTSGVTKVPVTLPGMYAILLEGIAFHSRGYSGSTTVGFPELSLLFGTNQADYNFKVEEFPFPVPIPVCLYVPFDYAPETSSESEQK